MRSTSLISTVPFSFRLTSESRLRSSVSTSGALSSTSRTQSFARPKASCASLRRTSCRFTSHSDRCNSSSFCTPEEDSSRIPSPPPNSLAACSASMQRRYAAANRRFPETSELISPFLSRFPAYVPFLRYDLRTARVKALIYAHQKTRAFIQRRGFSENYPVLCKEL